MQRTFNVTRTSRNTISKFLDNYTHEQLNKVPHGFNNNLIWNIGHIIVVQQMLIYNLSGLPMMVSPEMIAKYKKGTRPETDATPEEIEEIRALLFTTIDQTEKDLENGIFKTYNEFTSMSGFSMKSAEDAMEFNNYHEAMHTGMMMGIRKFV
ncbi:MAG TPA: DinB family protein [Flavobacterium sp.]|nr:DinB family protein [Flavobacterium sp.]